jgi:hypothetical protein
MPLALKINKMYRTKTKLIIKSLQLRYFVFVLAKEISLVCCENEVYNWEFIVRIYQRGTVNEEGIVQSAI